MARHALEVADIVRLHGEEFARTHPLTLMQRKVLRDILLPHRGARRARLSLRGLRLRGELLQLLPRPELSKVSGQQSQAVGRTTHRRALAGFVLPYGLHAPAPVSSLLVLHNQRLMYNMLFQAVSRTLLEVGERKLHAKLGFLTLLHTWGQTLTAHPHLHVLIPGCGIDSRDGSPRRFHTRYLLSDKVLSRVFCGKFVAILKRAYRKGKLSLEGDLAMLANEHEFEQLLNEATAARLWCGTKPPFSGPTVVLISRATPYAPAISNSRLLSLDDDGRVSFTYRDYRQGGVTKVMRLSASDFLSRFLLHVLPKSFVRIRYYGFLSRGSKAKALELFRGAFGALAAPRNAP